MFKSFVTLNPPPLTIVFGNNLRFFVIPDNQDRHIVLKPCRKTADEFMKITNLFAIVNLGERQLPYRIAYCKNIQPAGQLLMRFIQMVFIASLFAAAFTCAAYATGGSGFAMHGKPALPEKFTRFAYTNPLAAKNGKVTYGVVGTFDGLNPFVIKSFRTTARGLFADEYFGSMVFESMMVRSRDEPFTLYGLLAQRTEINDERTEITFFLNPDARFSDGRPVTQNDVLFTCDLLKKKGRPPFDRYMKRITDIEKIGTHGVRFHLAAPADRELALIIASVMPVLPAHAVNPDTFEQNGLTIIPGTGPYIIDTAEPGQRIIYRRNPDYWGKNLAVNCGFNNFEQIQIEYFRNDNARFEAFKKGILDVFIEDLPNRWRLGYDFPAVQDGHVIKESFKKGTPANMIGFVFNTRRSFFADRRVRQALSMIFDFEWVNRNLYGGIYTRTEGFWDGSALSSVGRPADKRERALLAPYPDMVSADIMEGRWHPPHTDGSGLDRAHAEAAWQLLLEVGFSRKGGKTFTPDGQPFHFEIMTQTSEEEKNALAYQHFLSRLGIDVTVRTVDDTQYQNRLSNFDYDMIVGKLSASLSPGNEQVNRWASVSHDMKGSFNYAGVAAPAVDAMIQAMLEARTKADFRSAVRAMDRILISQHYYLPLYHLSEQWVARWSHIHRPDYTPLYGFRLPAWWRAEH